MNHRNIKNHVILLTGSCASGKSTVAKLLQSHHNYHSIDGDIVWQQVKESIKPKKVHWNDIHPNLMETAKRKVKTKNVAISHVVLPDKIEKYERWSEKEGIPIYICILHPPLYLIQDRNRKRTCWSKPTPDYVINTMYSLFETSKEIYPQYFYTNIEETPEEIVKGLLKKINV